VLTFYIPSGLLIVFCTALIAHTFCSLSRQSAAAAQSCLEHADAKHRLLSVTSSSGGGGASLTDVERVRSSAVRYRRLTLLTLLLVFGGLSWGCAAAASLLEQRRTLAGTVTAGFYAVCTTVVALLLTFLNSPSSKFPTTNARQIFTQGGCLEQLASSRNFGERRTAEDVTRQPSDPVSKQVVYSIVNSATTVQAGDEMDYMSDTERQEVLLGMRDCTGSSCSVPMVTSLSVAELSCVPAQDGGQCWCCRSVTDGGTVRRCPSRNSTRMRDFDDFSRSSSDDDWPPEGRWWNDSEVDVDGCSIHRAPCPSPASACTEDNDEEESGSSGPHQEASAASQKRRCVGASLDTVRKTRRRYDNELDVCETEHFTRDRRECQTDHIRLTKDVRSSRSIDKCNCRATITTRHKRRRLTTKSRRRNRPKL